MNACKQHRLAPSLQQGQSMTEYLVVCGALALILGVGMIDDDSVLRMLIKSFETAYNNFSYAISLPG